MDGVFVRWDEPQLIDGMTGHAGEFPNCQCRPEPVIKSISGKVYAPALPVRPAEAVGGAKTPGQGQTGVQPPAAPPGVLENSLGIRQGAPLDIPAATSGANPNYSQGKEYQENCQRCVPAYELRRRGYDVEALPVVNGVFGPVTRGAECFKGAQFTGYPDDKGLTLLQLGSHLRKMPDGARVAVAVKLTGAVGGHTFVCEKVNGVLQFIDPQEGKGGSGNLTAGKRFGYYRMDNLDLSDALDWTQVVRKAGP
jgi:hypothetical protein